MVTNQQQWMDLLILLPSLSRFYTIKLRSPHLQAICVKKISNEN